VSLAVVPRVTSVFPDAVRATSGDRMETRRQYGITSCGYWNGSATDVPSERASMTAKSRVTILINSYYRCSGPCMCIDCRDFTELVCAASTVQCGTYALFAHSQYYPLNSRPSRTHVYERSDCRHSPRLRHALVGSVSEAEWCFCKPPKKISDIRNRHIT
jgi:hypothetical protein